MTNSQKLLREYADNGSEEAFGELVANYTDLVYSAALRLANGDTHFAKDIAQTVFVDLARQSARMSAEVMLGGWLHRHTCYVGSNMLRSERRRHFHEKRSVEMSEPRDQTQNDLAELAPLVDEAINQLGPEDREAIVLRYFEQRDLRSVGEVIGSTADTAQKRVSRALEKLHSMLRQRGVSLSVAALGSALASGAVTAAPAGLALTLSSAALGSAALSAGTSLTFLEIITMNKITAGIAGAVLIGAAVTSAVIHLQTRAKLQQQASSLQDQAAQLAVLAEENQRLTNALAQASRTIPPDQMRELLRLRAEVSALRQKAAEQAKTSQKTEAVARQQAQANVVELQRQAAITKMNVAKFCVLAFHTYAQEHQGRFPGSFAEVAKEFDQALTKYQEANDPPPDPDEYRELVSRFEILYQGSLDNLSNPASTIILREKEPWQSAHGGWNRAYGFADGHSEIHKSDTGDFSAWEAERIVTAPAPAQEKPESGGSKDDE